MNNFDNAFLACFLIDNETKVREIKECKNKTQKSSLLFFMSISHFLHLPFTSWFCLSCFYLSFFCFNLSFGTSNLLFLAFLFCFLLLAIAWLLLLVGCCFRSWFCLSSRYFLLWLSLLSCRN